MSWITSKGRVEGIARQVLEAEKRYGAANPEVTVRNWNERFNFVETEDELERLVTAVELQIPVIRNEKNIPHVSKVAYGVFNAVALVGKLDEDIEGALLT